MGHLFFYIILFILNYQTQHVMSDNCIYNKVNNIDECGICCTGDYNQNWAEQIKQIAEQHMCEKIALEISSAKFASKQLPSDWLNAIKTIPIETITFDSCDFEHIKSNALMNIRGLKKLHFSRGAFNYFEKSFFGYLPELKVFHVRNFDGKLQAEARLLENVPNLEILGFAKCTFDAQFISNITGAEGSTFSMLQIIDLRFNTIGKLTDHMFSKVSNLRALYLSSSGLEEITKMAFWSVNIMLIDITQNSLTTLKDGSFENIKHTQWQNRTLVINDNPWKCDCRLKWLQDLYNSPEIVHITPEPICDTSEPFSSATFCSNSTTESTTAESSDQTTLTTEVSNTTEVATTESSYQTTSTTTEVPIITTKHSNHEETHYIKCIDAENKFAVFQDNIPKTFLGSTLIHVSTTDKTLSKVDVYNVDDDSKVKLYFDGTMINFSLVYFESLKPDIPECIGNILTNFVEINNLTPNHTYTFCVVLENEMKVPPMSCFGLHIPPNWDDRGWIANEDKLIFIICLPVILVICAIISAIMAFCVIRKFPKLIEGNQNVIILKRTKSRPLPQQHTEQPKQTEYAEPTFSDNTQSGYLTPACPNYEKVQYNRKSSTCTYDSKSQSYIRPNYDTSTSLCENRLKCINETNETNDVSNYEKIY